MNTSEVEVTQEIINNCEPSSYKECAIAKTIRGQDAQIQITAMPRWIQIGKVKYTCSEQLYKWQRQLMHIPRKPPPPITLLINHTDKTIGIENETKSDESLQTYP